MYKFNQIKDHLHRWHVEDNYLVKRIYGYLVKLLFEDDKLVITVVSRQGTEMDRTVTEEDYNKLITCDFDLRDHIYNVILDINRVELTKVKEKVWKT